MGEPQLVTDIANVRRHPTERILLSDERGIGLRATWHHDRGIVNLSIWRGDRCVETFRLTHSDAGRLIGFLGAGLADAVTTTWRTRSDEPVVGRNQRPDLASAASAGVRALRARLSDWIAPEPDDAVPDRQGDWASSMAASRLGATHR